MHMPCKIGRKGPMAHAARRARRPRTGRSHVGRPAGGVGPDPASGRFETFRFTSSFLRTRRKEDVNRADDGGPVGERGVRRGWPPRGARRVRRP
ncbi:hypothetical protein M2169_005380 [Streptomyces sp. MJP52]|nr:hypothetical protein [Streptomyces sp. MJP52]